MSDRTQTSGPAFVVDACEIDRTFATRSGELSVLRGVSLRVAAGASTAIMGPSGSGKSTLLNILGTLDRPTRGTLRIDGRDPFALGATELARFRNERIGFIFQEHHLLPQCSALENVLLPSLAVVGGPDRLERGRGLLDQVGLTARADHRPAELSGGERQRVAIARALLNGPRLLLADEPTGNLDRATGEQVVELLLRLQAALSFALVVVTHSDAVAQRFGRVLHMTDGALADGGAA